MESMNVIGNKWNPMIFIDSHWESMASNGKHSMNEMKVNEFHWYRNRNDGDCYIKKRWKPENQIRLTMKHNNYKSKGIVQHNSMMNRTNKTNEQNKTMAPMNQTNRT